jgi:hypothetical protein
VPYLNTDALPPGYRIVGVVDSPEHPGERYFVIVHDAYVVLLQKVPARPMIVQGREIPTDEPGFDRIVFEMPLDALPWLVDTIENGFWRKASEGGLAKDVLHVNEVIGGEDLLIRFSPNCRGEGVQGFSLKNYNRKGRVKNWQEMQIPYGVLREAGMLDLWKQLIAERD